MRTSHLELQKDVTSHIWTTRVTYADKPHTHTHTHTHTRTHTHTYAHAHTHTHLRTHKYNITCTIDETRRICENVTSHMQISRVTYGDKSHTHTHTHTYTHTQTRTHTHTLTNTHTQTCTHIQTHILADSD